MKKAIMFLMQIILMAPGMYILWDNLLNSTVYTSNQLGAPIFMAVVGVILFAVNIVFWDD